MYGRTFIFVENFYVNNLSVVLEIFHVFDFFWDKGTHKNYFSLKHFPIYSICIHCVYMYA